MSRPSGTHCIDQVGLHRPATNGVQNLDESQNLATSGRQVKVVQLGELQTRFFWELRT